MQSDVDIEPLSEESRIVRRVFLYFYRDVLIKLQTAYVYPTVLFFSSFYLRPRAV